MYRRYFPADWLSFVRDEHVWCRVGDAGAEMPLMRAFRHTSLDVAALVLDGEKGSSLPVLKLAREENSAGRMEADVGTEVWIDGHVAADQGVESIGNGGVARLDGTIVLVDGVSRGFVDTGPEESVLGMCGGPIVRRTDGAVVGLLEGLVPKLGAGEEALSEQHGLIVGSSVFVTAISLKMFIADVEKAWCAEEKIGWKAEGKVDRRDEL
jgi:hypothetical protein